MPANAAIYLSDPSLMGSKFFDKIPDIQSYEVMTEGDAASGVRFRLDAGEVAMNFMPEDQVAEHLQGFAGFAQRVIEDEELLAYAQSRIQHVRLACGCVITPGFDDDGKIQEFLFRFNGALNGLLFLADTIFDYDGQALGGRYAKSE